LDEVPGCRVHGAGETAAALAGAFYYRRQYSRHPSPYDDSDKFGRWLIDYAHSHWLGCAPSTRVAAPLRVASRPTAAQQATLRRIACRINRSSHCVTTYQHPSDLAYARVRCWFASKATPDLASRSTRRG